MGKSQVAFSSRPLSFVICSGCFASNQCISLVLVKKEKNFLEKFRVEFYSNEFGNRINITVLDPKEGATVRYGNGPDNCTMEESPIFVIPGLHECYYEVSAPYRESCSGVAYINISQMPSSMELEVERDIYADENGTACFDMVARIPENATGNVTWSFDGKEYISDIKDGYSVATIDGVLDSGNHTVHARYSGDDNYYGCNNSTAVTVHYLPITISGDNVTVS